MNFKKSINKLPLIFRQLSNIIKNAFLGIFNVFLMQYLYFIKKKQQQNKTYFDTLTGNSIQYKHI